MHRLTALLWNFYFSWNFGILAFHSKPWWQVWKERYILHKFDSISHCVACSSNWWAAESWACDDGTSWSHMARKNDRRTSFCLRVLLSESEETTDILVPPHERSDALFHTKFLRIHQQRLVPTPSPWLDPWNSLSMLLHPVHARKPLDVLSKERISDVENHNGGPFEDEWVLWHQADLQIQGRVHRPVQQSHLQLDWRQWQREHQLRDWFQPAAELKDQQWLREVNYQRTFSG